MSGPDEGFRLGVGLCEETGDGGFEFGDGSEYTPLETSSRKLGKEAFDGIEPGCGGGGEVERPTRMSGEPFTNRWMLMSCIVIDDRMDFLSFRHLGLDSVEETNELLVPVTLHVAADDGAVENVEGSKQRRGPIAFIVVGHRPSAARLHRQAWLGAIERLDLAFLVDREDNSVIGGIDVEPDNVLELFSKFWVVRQLERLNSVRSELVRLQDALDRPQAHPCGLCQHPAGPLGRFPGWRSERQIDDALHGIGRQRLLAGLARLVARQPLNAFRHKAGLPCPNHRFRFAGPAHDFGRAATIGRRQDDIGAPHMLLRRAPICDNRLKPTAVASRDVNDNSCSHTKSMDHLRRFGNRPNESHH